MKYGRFRIATQTVVFLLMFAIPLLNVYELYFITGTYYALNVGGLGVADPVVILQAMFASGQLTLPLLSAAVFPIFVALIMGRVWCGWLCPYLFISDRVESLRQFIRRKVFKVDHPVANREVQNSFRANFIRFSFLITGTAFGGMLGIPVLNYISAPGILSTEAMIFVKERSFSIEILFVLGIVGLQLTLLPRFWCRMFCPTGALLSLIRSPQTLRVDSLSKHPTTPCCKEISCSDVCPMGLQPYRESRDLLCVNCGQCIDACKHDRLRFYSMGSA
ncbi:MAG: 4Fe-4S binding protein [Deltaproteobacteria bacterium]|nr:4Fe-4S binding protein [Deltaproteobacteria bacterium]